MRIHLPRNTVSLPACLCLLALIGCRKEPVRDMWLAPEAYPDAPSVHSLQQKVSMGMSQAQVVAILGSPQSAGGNQTQSDIKYVGSDRNLYLLLQSDRVQQILTLPHRQPMSEAAFRQKVREGMTELEVYQAVGTERLSYFQTDQICVIYPGTDKKDMVVTFKNDRVTDIATKPN